MRVDTVAGNAAIMEYFRLDRYADIFVAKEVCIFGTSYRNHLYVIVDVSDENYNPIFGYITSILVGVTQPAEVHFVIHECRTIDFSTHLHAYIVEIKVPKVYRVFYVHPSSETTCHILASTAMTKRTARSTYHCDIMSIEQFSAFWLFSINSVR